MEKDRTPSTISTVSVPVTEEHERAQEPLPTRTKEHPRGSLVLGRFPASHPRGSWPAEDYAPARRAEGTPATLAMNLTTDDYLVPAATV